MARLPGRFRQHIAGENIGDVSHGLVGVDLIAVRGADSGALLPAVLQRVEAEVGQFGCLGVAVDGDHATFFVKFVGTTLSNMRFECPLVSGPQRRDVPGTQRRSPLPDLHPSSQL